MSDWSSDVCSSDLLLAPDAVGQAPRPNEEAHADQGSEADDDFGGGIVDLHRPFEEGKAREHRGIPDDGEGGGETEQRDTDAARLAGIGAAFYERVIGQLAFGLPCLDPRTLGEVEGPPNGSGDTDPG